MESKKIFLSIILLLLIACGVRNSTKEIGKGIDFNWYKYTLSKVNENTFEASNENQVRFIIAQPFGFEDYLLGIKDLETEFLIYRKKISKTEVSEKNFEAEGLLMNAEDFRNKWNEILTICESKKGDNLERGEVGDRPTWVLEIKYDSIYQLKIGILGKEDLDWVKQIFELTPYGLPEKLPYDF